MSTHSGAIPTPPVTPNTVTVLGVPGLRPLDFVENPASEIFAPTGINVALVCVGLSQGTCSTGTVRIERSAHREVDRSILTDPETGALAQSQIGRAHV